MQVKLSIVREILNVNYFTQLRELLDMSQSGHGGLENQILKSQECLLAFFYVPDTIHVIYVGVSCQI
jgi:hypothetical protein